jgi:uncharacterized sodium:solute symporter family permease YidK
MFDDNLPWQGTLVGVPAPGFYFWCTHQFTVQRVLGARDILNARRGALFAGLLKLPVLFLMVLPGGTGRPRDGDILRALMSSIDSTLNSATALKPWILSSR